MSKYVMVIDLQRCAGCGSCILACKTENNLTEGIRWADKITETKGTFPNVRYNYTPTRCNHCSEAPCVSGCPTTAMYKTEEGITMHAPDKCIGCRYCMSRCPYGVISFNAQSPHERWGKREASVVAGASAGAEVVDRANGNVPPYFNPEPVADYAGVRPKGVVEKCIGCYHRLKQGELPYCVEACPAKARIYGDIEDPSSDVSRILASNTPTRLKEELGTEPNVYYISSFNSGIYNSTEGGV